MDCGLGQEADHGWKQLKAKVSGLRSWHVDLGLDCEKINNDSVQRLIRGIQRYHGEKGTKQAVPITLAYPSSSHGLHRRHPSLFGGTRCALTLIAAFTVAFACFLRGGNFTYETNKFDPGFDLCRHHVHLDPPTPFIHIPASKTDTFRKGIDVFLPTGIPDDDSPTTALRVLLESFPGPLNSPLFTLSPLQPSFPRKTVIDRYLSLAMREADIRGEFSGHSFRRGAATWAASVGCSAEDIKALDRWKSSSFERYIDIPNSRKHDLVSSMFLQTSSLSGDGVVHPSSVFDPDL